MTSDTSFTNSFPETYNDPFNKTDLLWYWFVNIKGIGNITRNRLIEIFGHPLCIYHGTEEELLQVLTKKQLTYFYKSKNIDRLIHGMNRLKEEHTQFLHWESPDYPEKLRHIPDPPYGLYLRGHLPDPNRPSLAMVGSRRATEYGKRIAGDFAKKFAASGIQIISGLAAGIDTASHRGALEGRGYTLGVLGGGIDSIYPKENFNLYMKMYEEGGVLSEWNLGVINKSGLFPMRNRLISALSDGVFVLEAADRSGTFITVDQALEQGRTVFALPGRITDPNSRGTNQLIRDGAIPVLSPEDIIENLLTEKHTERGEGSSPGGSSMNRPEILPEGSPEGRSVALPKESSERRSVTLPDEYREVFDLLDEQNPTDFSTLLGSCGYDIGKLSHILFELESSGMIYQPRQNIYLKSV